MTSDPPLSTARWSAAPRPAGLLIAAAFLGAAATLTALSRAMLPETSGLFLFFAAVLLSATRFGFWVGIASAVAAFVLFNFLFVPPLYTLQIENPADLVALAEFLLVAALTGFLAGRLREEADAAKSRAAVLEVLSDFAADLAHLPDTDALLTLLPRHLSALTKGGAVVLVPRDGALALHAADPATELTAADWQAADRARRRQITEPGVQPGWEGSALTFVPLLHGDTLTAILGHASLDRRSLDLPFRDQAIAIICRQTSLALDRSAFAQAAEQARIAADREALRAALLTSLSHDLRTPLATILGSITTLRELRDTLPAPARIDLELAIEEEAQRLSRYVDNLLHMTRLQSGLTLRPTWVDPGDILTAAITRARRAFPSARISAAGAEALPLIRAEAGLLEQALFNLIDNAVKFSTAPAQVQIASHATETDLTLSVTDQGIGIAPDVMARIFTPFFRADPARTSGSGLGLTICLGIATALGGSLTVESPSSGGTTFHLRLPLPQAAP